MATDFKSIPLIGNNFDAFFIPKLIKITSLSFPFLEFPLMIIFRNGFFYIYNTDISPLVEKWDDPNAAQDERVAEVVRQLDKACREAGFFYVVSLSLFFSAES